MQFSTIFSLLAVVGMTVAAPPVVHPQSNKNGVVGLNVADTTVPVDVDVPIQGNNVADNVANGLLDGGVNLDHTVDGPLNVAALGKADQIAPKGALPPF
ncbi:hypothetical protein IFM51744_10568 [Aspergillus udagawae]|uniref:Uncharacterized protein n=1 Tax=Aspergillus udagawae TaxID=91492 RepID=A0A8E0V3N4_9EURO|nr:uncharacterized protein Aud_007397 [Aspergillus udagawae]GFF54542.1 hypothetical protein IFM46972_10049 [Aspergillus udagawae]GFF61037.1 hypothetical protein IFM51744_10568 [Aspergillus udagawae]GFF94646.1 hypothetical protein IFM53868_07633 [Aspergillus udagawae]GFG17373.1 hypothetical protein IFM5058_08441 [Aspergillus udagawae]GIC90959.1 hypothetical protein Aud_007397 [Aspergillus udagawae]